MVWQVEEAGSGLSLDMHAAARFVSALRKLEYAAGRHHAGSLLLAQDPLELNRRAVPLLLSPKPLSLRAHPCTELSVASG